MKKYFLLAICIGTTFNCHATQDVEEDLLFFKRKIEHAIVKIEDTKREHWSYTISRYEDEEGDITSSVERYSPKSREQWLLKQINGEQPSKKQIENFVKKKSKQIDKKKQEKNIQIPLRELINQETLSVVANDEKYIIMAFDVHWKKLGEDSLGKLKGQLRYQIEKQFIEEISIWNNAEFSPMFTAKITDLAVKFTFLQINEAVLSKQYEMKMKGSFAYFTEINETSIDSFSDYLYQGD